MSRAGQFDGFPSAPRVSAPPERRMLMAKGEPEGHRSSGLR